MHFSGKHTDEQIFALVKKGDETAFNELYHRYWDKLLVRAVTQLSSEQDAEEVLHDVFVSLWNRRDKIELKYKFHTYIAAMLKYEVIRRLAIRKKRAFDPLYDQEDKQVLDDSTRQLLDFQDLQRRLEASVQRLPTKCQLVFRLSREQALNDKEIASTLNIAPKTVQNHLNHALRALRSSLSTLLAAVL